MRHSFGIVVLNEHCEVLLCHVTGAPQWDIPKGGADPGECPQAAAIRETFEECGLLFAPVDLEDLGEMAYLDDKRLHLFLARVQRSDVALEELRCISTFRDRKTGDLRPEVDRYEWVELDQLSERCTVRMTAALRAIDALRGADPRGPPP